MATADRYLKISQFHNNEMRPVRFLWDFSVDGGATGAFDLGEMDEAMVIVDGYCIVQTACTSGGSATVIVGDTDDTDSILASTAVASLTANATFDLAAAGVKKYLAVDKKIILTVGTAALTAGKIEVVLFLAKK